MVFPSQKTEHWHDAVPLNCVVLVVDDCEDDRAVYRRFLESSSLLACKIYDCELGEEAFQLYEKYRPDIILLDYLLPDLNGIELLQALAEQLERMPAVIMLTGEGSEAVAVEAMKLGAKDYLTKGQLTPETLIKSIANLLAEKNLQSQLQWQRLQRELLTSVTFRISHATELSEIMQVAVQGARVLLNCDRTLVYRLATDGSGTIVAESVLAQWTSVFDHRVEDNCFQGQESYQLNKYLQGHKMMVSDIETANLTPCHLEMLQQIKVKANLVVPILYRDLSAADEPRVWGLLISHHCKTTHEWTADELDLMDEMAIQMAIAIQQAELVSDLKVSLEKQEKIEIQLRNYSTELEQSNLRLAQAARLLERRNEELDEFTYIASHDLKAPLRGIANLSQWLVEDLQDQIPAENKQQLDRIQGQISRMDALIDGLLQYSRVGKESIAFSSINLSQLLEEVVDFLAPTPGIQIQFPSNLPCLNTKELLLKQVFSNLIGNAIKYHHKNNGIINISIADQESFLKFTITDDGPGIAPKYHHKIFGIFQTLAKSNDLKGTGVGLAIVKKIVEAQGGSIWVESQLEEGSAFSFTWPKQHSFNTTPFAEVDKHLWTDSAEVAQQSESQGHG
jgi:signal transduction histidine kinase/CheY-like chemotaxis protein